MLDPPPPPPCVGATSNVSPVTLNYEYQCDTGDNSYDTNFNDHFNVNCYDPDDCWRTSETFTFPTGMSSYFEIDGNDCGDEIIWGPSASGTTQFTTTQTVAITVKSTLPSPHSMYTFQ